MSDYIELKRLAEAATPGPWAYDGSYVCPARTEDGTTYVELWRSIADCHQPENTKFIAAANPAAVMALIAEVESLREHKQLLVDLREADGYESWASVLVMVDKLKAENEDLRKDAERYRFLRQDISNNVQDFCIVKKRWSATFPDRILELDGADAEIDAAMGKGAKP